MQNKQKEVSKKTILKVFLTALLTVIVLMKPKLR